MQIVTTAKIENYSVPEYKSDQKTSASKENAQILLFSQKIEITALSNFLRNKYLQN